VLKKFWQVPERRPTGNQRKEDGLVTKVGLPIPEKISSAFDR